MRRTAFVAADASLPCTSRTWELQMGTPCNDVVAGATDFREFSTSHTAQRGIHDSGKGASSKSMRDAAIVADPSHTG